MAVSCLVVGATLTLAACSGRTTGATKITETSVALHGIGRCAKGETCTWYWEYWRASLSRFFSNKTPVEGPVTGPIKPRAISTTITGGQGAGLFPGVSYRWVLCGSPNDGASYGCVGPNGIPGSATADPPPDYGTFAMASPGTLAEHWNGTRWAIRRTPSPGTGRLGSGLNGISCTSPPACTAVGSYSDSTGTIQALVERWDGTSWTVQTVPNASGVALVSVSCPAANACTAVGISPTNGPVAAQWDGTAWTIQSTPGDASYSLTGVSCTSATACTAVGAHTTGAHLSDTLAERWDGTKWTIQATPNVSGSFADSLAGVSCPSTTACSAVGGYSNFPTGASGAVAERWDGTSWNLQSVPASGNLSAVSCTSATACSAVGSFGLAEVWDGTSWTTQATPTPTGASSTTLSGISCTSPTACTAVGNYFPGSVGPQLTLAERWDGTSWTIQPTPNPVGASASGLGAVSCTSATRCTAVGFR